MVLELPIRPLLIQMQSNGDSRRHIGCQNAHKASLYTINRQDLLQERQAAYLSSTA
jgi:hypothetical protein